MAWLNGKRTVQCRKCWGKGHNIRNCPTNTPEQKAAYADGAKARTCSYCGEAKHNKISCVKRKADMVEYARVNGEHRKTVLEYMTNLGYGIGALVTIDNRNMSAENMYIITDIDWSCVQQKAKSLRFLTGISIGDTNYPREMSLPGEYNYYSWSTAHVVSRAKIAPEPPSDWLDGTSGIEGYFK